MRKFGPQYDEEMCFRLRSNDLLNWIHRNVDTTQPRGACVVWSTIYQTYLRDYHSRFSNDNDLMVFLRENPLVGEISPFELLGKMSFDKNVDTDLKNFLLKVYEIIPNESELVCLDTEINNGECLTTYHSDILKTYDKITKHWDRFRSTNPITTVRFLKELANHDKKRTISIHTFNIMVSKLVLKLFFMTEIHLFNLIFVMISCKHAKFFK